MTSGANVVPLTKLGKAGGAYTYSIPSELDGRLTPGQLVEVPFRRSALTGIVLDLEGSFDGPGLRAIKGVIEEQPVILPHQLEVMHWIAREYAAPLAEVLSGMLPPGLKSVSKARAGRITAMGAISITPEGEEACRGAEGGKRVTGQQKVLSALMDMESPIMESDLITGTGTGKVTLNKLEKAGYILRLPGTALAGKAEVTREAVPSPFALSPAQARAVKRIISSPTQTGETFLLHGVTGSGKTEVYMAVIREVLLRGQGAIVMVPEISLTPQALERFASRFPGTVARLHSKLTERERWMEWERIRLGEAHIAVGARSALFAPMPNLGAIIVDEEHDPSYKQGDTPRYHARDVAIWLGNRLKIPVVLGSATPDVATYFGARKGSHVLLGLPDRPVWKSPSESGQKDVSESREMPEVQIVDLRQELKAGNRGIFSRSLAEALEETVASGHQALLFLNRRGAATAVVCRDCGYVASCDRCGIPLTFHSTRSRLICHRCDRRLPSPSQCRECGSDRIRYLGVGTQRVVEEVERTLPQARVLRWDRDVTGKKGAHEAIAGSFGRHEADVLVGTQMIAKGLDFPLVTLVGVILADVGLHLPDFRAPERTFQLMTQVAGRAGRADLPSKVIIQAYTPNHYALEAAKCHDYWSFYSQEMIFRQGAGYPPFGRLVRLLLRGRDSTLVERRAMELRETLLREISVQALKDTEVIGPAPAFVARVDNMFQWHVILRGHDVHPLLHLVPDDVSIDVDPVDML